MGIFVVAPLPYPLITQRRKDKDAGGFVRVRELRKGRYDRLRGCRGDALLRDQSETLIFSL